MNDGLRRDRTDKRGRYLIDGSGGNPIILGHGIYSR